MQNAILITAMILGTLLFLSLRPTRAVSRDGRKRDRRSGFGAGNPFHAVSIQAAQESCLAAESISQQRFLSDDAPGLPLAECSAVECSCRYVHHADRRSGARDRRFSAMGESDESEYWTLRNRRLVGGRRQSDQQAA
jgi:hypothetical protein